MTDTVTLYRAVDRFVTELDPFGYDLKAIEFWTVAWCVTHDTANDKNELWLGERKYDVCTYVEANPPDCVFVDKLVEV